jgi:hypothetical protein
MAFLVFCNGAFGRARLDVRADPVATAPLESGIASVSPFRTI